MKPDLIILKDIYGIYQLPFDHELPELTEIPGFYSVTKTSEEISIVCDQSVIIDSGIAVADETWKIIKFQGPLSLSLTGIISEVTQLLSENNIPVFVISTFNTDYILVKAENMEKAVMVLKNNDYKISYE